jgi:nitronate monooxygenase
MLVASSASDIVYTNLFTGIHGNYLKASIVRAGLDPENLPESDPSAMNFSTGRNSKPWRDIWGAGQGVGALKEVLGAADLIARLIREYERARAGLAAGR